MTIEEAIDILSDNHTVLYSHGDYTEQEENETLSMAIKSLEAWGKLRGQIQSIKIMKERLLDTAGDLTTAYILRGEIGMLEVVIAIMSENLSEVQDGQE